MPKPDYLKVQKKYGRKGLMSRLFLIISRCMAGCDGDRNKRFQGFEVKKDN
jgi:hypothetical protein